MTWEQVWTVVLSVITSMGGAAAIAIGCFKFYGEFWAKRILANERAEFEKAIAKDRQAFEEKLQSLKDRIVKGQFVHKLQFETEFKSYLGLWRRAIDCRDAVGRLRPVHDAVPIGQSEDDRRKERIDALAPAFNQYVAYYAKHRPFVDSLVFEAAQSLNNEVFNEYCDFQARERGDAEYWQERRKNTDKIVEAVDQLCDAIRQRIWIDEPLHPKITTPKSTA